jgi:hypothetical protein
MESELRLKAKNIFKTDLLDTFVPCRETGT